MRTDTGQVFKLEDYRPSDYLIPAIDMAFALAPDATRVVATLTVERRQGVAAGTPLLLDGAAALAEAAPVVTRRG